MIEVCLHAREVAGEPATINGAKGASVQFVNDKFIPIGRRHVVLPTVLIRIDDDRLTVTRRELSCAWVISPVSVARVEQHELVLMPGPDAFSIAAPEPVTLACKRVRIGGPVIERPRYIDGCSIGGPRSKCGSPSTIVLIHGRALSWARRLSYRRRRHRGEHQYAELWQGHSHV